MEPTMWNWIRNKLNIDTFDGRLRRLEYAIEHQNENVMKMRMETAAMFSGIGRIIAHFDSTFAEDPLSAEMKDRSDALCEAVTRRFTDEALARAHTAPLE